MNADKKILAKLQRFCVYRERSVQEVKEKLALLNVPYAQYQLYISLLEEQKFLNEQRFIKAFINDKFKINRWGKNKIKQALALHKISAHEAEEMFESCIDEQKYQKNLQHIITRFKPKTKGLENYKAQQKILAHCYAKGYEPEFTRKILEQLKEE